MLEADPSTATAADAGRLIDTLGDYREWRDALVTDIRQYQEWVQAEGVSEAEDELRIFELAESLKSERLLVALVAEFSRGKTELINAMFFADYRRRLLPSTAGRTTMCPTEILYNEDQQPGVMLLPIETRKTGTTIAEYKREPINWTVLPLDLKSADNMADTLSEIVRTKQATRRELEELGLTPPDDDRKADTFEIPVWRHAIINYPHPLLKRGLAILDTPGLNALGSEPELTLSMLPNAHAVLFVLAADTGVTRSDLDVWQNHVRIAAGPDAKGCVAILNKVDTLWDDLRPEADVAATIDSQCEEAVKTLGIPRSNVFPVSAQKALLGRVKGDAELVKRSGLERLEAKLSGEIVAAKRALVREKVINEIGGMMQGTRVTLQTRLDAARAELNDLQAVRGKNEKVLKQMTQRLRDQKKLYDKEVESFEVTRRLLSDQIRKMLSHMSMTSFDKLMDETRKSMQQSWTTQGLRRGMEIFFRGSSKRMDRVHEDARKLKALVDEVYNRFHAEHGLPRLRPSNLSVLQFRKDMRRLEVEGEAFRNSAAMLMSEQHFVIKKFFITLASQAREIFNQCGQSTKTWAKSILVPVYTQIQEHKVMIDRRVQNFEQIEKDYAHLGARVRELKKEVTELELQGAQMQAMMERVYQPPVQKH
ncbi:MAG: dynamin family protein [Gammaproteobacteria bacterium]|nr:dynamin family protein [Gammaproteobacteria bacterium]